MRTFRIDHDLFFISQAFLDQHRAALSQALVVPIKEYDQHSSYATVHSATNHSSWSIRCDHVIVAEEGWYERQPPDLQQALYQESVKSGSSFVDKDRLITIRYWNSLSPEAKRSLIAREDEAPGTLNLDSIAGHAALKAQHGVYPSQHGANCFAAVLYAISQNPFIMNEWVHQQTFQLFLHQSGYRMVDGSAFQEGDVLCFYDEDSLQHACYAVDAAHCFNKSGQSFWEPWTITPFARIREDWEGLQHKVYRRLERP